MIHYLLLLRPVTFQHEPPSYYHYHQRHPVPIPTKPRKPQQQKHQYQSICNSASTSTSSLFSSTSHITTQATASTTKTTVGERIQFCNCLHCITPSSSTSNTNRREEAIPKQSANSNFRRGNNLPKACKSQNQQENKDRQEENYPSVSIDRSCRWNSSSSSSHHLSHHHSQQSKTVGASSASEQSQTAKDQLTPARPPTSENDKEFSQSSVGRKVTERIKPISNFESGKRFRPSPLPRFLSTLRKLHFPFTTRIAVAPTSKKRKEGKEEGKLILEKHSPKQTHSYSSFSSSTITFSSDSSPSPSTSEPHQPKNAHVVAANKLEKTAITVKSASPTTTTGSPSSSSALASSPEEKEAVCGSRNVHTTPEGSQAEGSQEGDGSSNSTISNCSNISNNNRKKSSKNFEKLKKFLLFCKGLRKKSK
ncbi:unnamed protein product [Orchesella dallaii]|uniref:Uncharacterized protein n=1 Tax=Orchesella dallaii TaxID=48710 RepID=A0ABP1QQ70_9HEXA